PAAATPDWVESRLTCQTAVAFPCPSSTPSGRTALRVLSEIVWTCDQPPEVRCAACTTRTELRSTHSTWTVLPSLPVTTAGCSPCLPARDSVVAVSHAPLRVARDALIRSMPSLSVSFHAACAVPEKSRATSCWRPEPAIGCGVPQLVAPAFSRDDRSPLR